MSLPTSSLSAALLQRYIQDAVHDFQSELVLRTEVVQAMHDLTHAVEMHALNDKYLAAQDKFDHADRTVSELAYRVKSLEAKNRMYEEQIQGIRRQAGQIKEQFSAKAEHFLSEISRNQYLKDRVEQLEKMLQQSKEQSLKWEGNHHKVERVEIVGAENPEIVKSDEVITGAQVKRSPESHQITRFDSIQKTTEKTIPRLVQVSDLDDNILLNIFSYLQTIEVLQFAQVSRYIYFRVDKIFGIESGIVKPEWGVKPIQSSALSDNLYCKLQRNENESVISNRSSFSGSTLPGLESILMMASPVASTSGSQANGSISGNAEPKLSKEMIDNMIKRLNGKYLISVCL